MGNAVTNSNLSQKISILQVLPEMRAGGVERGTIEIASYIAAQENFCSYVASAGGPMVNSLVKFNVNHITLNLKSKNPLIILLNIKKLINIIKKYDIKIIHARSRAPAWSAYFAAKLTKIIFITTFHGIYKQQSKFKKLYNSVMVKGQKVIAVSNFVKKHIQKNFNIDESKIITIPRGVDAAQFSNGISEKRLINLAQKYNIQFDKPIIILPGRITRWKGHVYFIEALEKLPHNSFLALIVGSDAGHTKYRNYLLSLISKKNLSNNVAIVDHESDMAALYMIADIVVSASIEPEAFGRIAIESQAMGKFIIATNIGGAQETIMHGKTGYLISPKDSKAIANAIKDFLEMDLENKKQLSEQAKLHVNSNFSLSSMQNKTFELYKELLNNLTLK